MFFKNLIRKEVNFMKLKMGEKVKIDEREGRSFIGMNVRVIGEIEYSDYQGHKEYREYLIQKNKQRFWLKHYRHLWKLCRHRPFVAGIQDIINCEVKNRIRRNGEEMVVLEEGKAIVKGIKGETEGVKIGQKVEYINGKFTKRENRKWPLFSIAMWDKKSEYYEGLKVNVRK